MMENPTLWQGSLSAMQVVVSKSLIGSKKALIQGNRIYVSPAMHVLMEGATQEELVRLLKTISTLEIPEYNPQSGDWELTSRNDMISQVTCRKNRT